ncbi:MULTISPECIES: FGGY-family carbohydrate kinase [Thermomonosporaceae]|uniref:FGGY-family carbohydrate kinase n=1 Tax=Thermomonosporaceae TaxID=2012 RepID=UPI00255AB719|nr:MULTISPECIES: FGGY-family carbohydrate kinase [Thermomonosporaceae]MDL4775838.1 FGGY-family carbohydrate kinase [Actinomadura xylanilytica]
MAMVCVDAGTTVIKAVGYDDAGREAVVARRPLHLDRPRPGWAEQDMGLVWETVASAVRQVAGGLDAPVEVISVTAQGDGVWLVDGAAEPTGPAILWNDGRAADVVRAWHEAGVPGEAFRLNGSLPFPGVTSAILAWLAEHEPARLERSAAALTCGGWLFARMTGRVAVDTSDASAPFTDIRRGAYSDELLALYGMPWARRLLPPIAADDGRTGELTGAAADRLGVPAGTPVVMAPYDIAATSIGCGTVSAGQACSVLGTTLCTQAVAGGVAPDAEPAGFTIALGLPGRYLRAFPTLSGGDVVQWACDLLGLSHPAELGELASRARPGAGGLVFLPHLSPAGERSPFLDPLVRGGFLGLSFEHRREDIALAVLEGLSLVVQDCLAATLAQPTELRICGGGASSAVWAQLIADVTGLRVLRSADAEPGARGAFLMGLAATGRVSRIEDAVDRYVTLRDAFEPDPAHTGFYRELYRDVLVLRDDVRAHGSRLAGLRDRAKGVA